MEKRRQRSSQAEEYVWFVAVSATPSAMTIREVEEASAADEELSAVRQCISGKPWDQLVYKWYLPCSGELCTIGKLILRGTRIVIPKSLGSECYPLPTKATWALLELSKSFVAKYGGLAWRESQRNIVKPATGVSRPTLPQPIRTTPLLTGPWRELANDLLGPLFSGESILVVVSYYSQYY